MMHLGVERPEYLWLLLLALPIVGLAWASRRQLPRGRAILATSLRLLLLLVLTFALAGLTRSDPVDDLGVVFVIDRSASVGEAGTRRAAEFVKAALASQGEEDVAGVVVFGGDALVESQAREELAFDGVESVPVPHQTDIAGGLRLATALLPSDRARRIVVLSDGEQTRGDAATQVLLTAGDDLEIAVVPLDSLSGADALLEDLLVPARVDEGAPYEVKVVARSDEPTAGRLRLYRNDDYLGELPVTLDGDRSQVFTFREQADESGLYRYRAVLQVDDAGRDVIPQNNEVVSTVQVSGKPRILYAEGYPEHAGHLARVLREAGFAVDVVEAGDLPAGPSGLRPYAAVVLSDIPAYALTTRQQTALQAYVRDLGRGLVMVGGDRSFGLGGYYKTPIEEALPVSVDIKDKTRFPKLGMVIAMDKSCSMGGGAGSKLEIAKEAGIRSAELLSDRDLLGVIGFDSAAAWIVPLTPMTNRAEVVDTIASIRTGGGTDIYPAIERGTKGLRATDASLKHLIVLSDGITAPGAFEPLIKGAAREHITLSAVAIGDDADRTTMQQFATWGGGNYYLVTDITAIPAIFTRETMLASRSFLIEDPVQVRRDMPSDVLEGLTEKSFPVFRGMVATEAKPRAVVGLITQEEGDKAPLPVLAHWRYGLGRSVAFTSDCKPRWSGAWTGSADYTRFWTQVARWTVGGDGAGDLDAVAEIVDGALVVTVDAYASDGGFLNFLDGQARVIAPDLSVRALELRQVAPGRYQAITPVDQDGSWLVGVSLETDGNPVGQAVIEAVQPYSPEYRPASGGGALLAELGRVGGGGVLTDPAAVFSRPTVPRLVPHPLWPSLLAASAFLLLLDVAARRLALSARVPAALAALREGVPSRRAFRQPFRPAAPPGGGRGRGAAPEAPTEEPVPDEPVLPEPPVVQPDSYAGRLLAARKKARDRLGDGS